MVARIDADAPAVPPREITVTYPAEPARLSWGSSPYYRGRAHLVAACSPRALCGTLIETTATKPVPLVCPECAITYADTTVARMVADRTGWDQW
ncbi:MAG TPA: hypothetical protein VM677_34835 [Actinokineospora sp.]|nr:hypothetical protein [Actinokineospora sp.]